MSVNYSLNALHPDLRIEIAHQTAYQPGQQIWESVIAWLCQKCIYSRIVQRVVIKSYIDDGRSISWHHNGQRMHLTVKLMLPNGEDDWCNGKRSLKTHPRLQGQGLDFECDAVDANRQNILRDRDEHEVGLIAVQHIYWNCIGVPLECGSIVIKEPAPKILPRDSRGWYQKNVEPVEKSKSMNGCWRTRDEQPSVNTGSDAPSWRVAPQPKSSDNSNDSTANSTPLPSRERCTTIGRPGGQLSARSIRPNKDASSRPWRAQNRMSSSKS